MHVARALGVRAAETPRRGATDRGPPFAAAGAFGESRGTLDFTLTRPAKVTQPSLEKFDTV